MEGGGGFAELVRNCSLGQIRSESEGADCRRRAEDLLAYRKALAISGCKPVFSANYRIAAHPH